MRIKMAVLLVLCALGGGCGSFSQGNSRDTQAQGIPCDGDPPNQPECSSRQPRDGWWNDRRY